MRLMCAVFAAVFSSLALPFAYPVIHVYRTWITMSMCISLNVTTCGKCGKEPSKNYVSAEQSTLHRKNK